ncbi:MAG: hypothetical protein CVV32_07350 [Methanomicrobiales archaeon HGW-Methanomicrobiales-3]|jgi:hypothetical protein|nr:MAG: hypothetical protein CVV32_07350 [Methanomicrobiales archaeon HGW-Methanomicrobiales-3]
MATVQSPGTGSEYRTAQPEQFRQISRSSTLLQSDEQDQVPKSFIEPEDYRELVLLDEFLKLHVRQDAIRNVQCMLLWTEWVRLFQRTTRRFPRVILENELRAIITRMMAVDIAHDTMRGPVYCGLRFVP